VQQDINLVLSFRFMCRCDLEIYFSTKSVAVMGAEDKALAEPSTLFLRLFLHYSSGSGSRLLHSYRSQRLGFYLNRSISTTHRVTKTPKMYLSVLSYLVLYLLYRNSYANSIATRDAPAPVQVATQNHGEVKWYPISASVGETYNFQSICK